MAFALRFGEAAGREFDALDGARVRVLVLKIGRRDEVYDVDKAELKRFVREIAKP